jgi:predicted signal transduction protein with EAL and GGDEF domain
VERLAEALRAAAPSGTPPVAVCFLDVDHFKHVNDSRSHAAGDSLLAEVARRIAATARAGDVVARFAATSSPCWRGGPGPLASGSASTCPTANSSTTNSSPKVASVLEETGVPPEFLVLEITESLFMRDLHAAVRRLNALRRLGVRVATYDFGIGFSSLNSL